MAVQPQRSGNGLSFWMASSLVLFGLQLATGTDPVYAMVALLIFALTPLVFRCYQRIDNMGAFVFLATYIKLFLVSQWLKVGFLQAADTHLLAPVETVVVLLMGLVAFWAAGLALTPLLTGRRSLLAIPNDPVFLTRVAIGATLITLVSIAMRFVTGLNAVDGTLYEEGRGFVIIIYLGQMLPLATAALTARASILSKGQRFIDVYVVLTILGTIFQGLMENQRTGMMAGAISFLVTYLAYGGRIRAWHIGVAMAAGIVMQILVFPLIEVQRGIRDATGIGEFIGETLKIASDLTDSEARAPYEQRLDDMYLWWDTRLYYGSPQGFIDRFAPNPLDETVDYLKNHEPLGVSEISKQTLYAAPNLILNIFGLERPPSGVEILETSILLTNSKMNYGVFAEIYMHSGMLLFFPLTFIIVFLYAGGLHLIYGKTRNNFFSAFGFSTLYFTFATSDLGTILPSLTLQGMIYLAFIATVSLLPRRDMAAKPA